MPGCKEKVRMLGYSGSSRLARCWYVYAEEKGNGWMDRTQSYGLCDFDHCKFAGGIRADARDGEGGTDAD